MWLGIIDTVTSSVPILYFLVKKTTVELVETFGCILISLNNFFASIHTEEATLPRSTVGSFIVD